MLDAIARLQRHLRDAARTEFHSNEVLQDAVIRQLEILGEAAGRVSKETCARWSDIPWPRITGLRHRLIHDYFEVDLIMVWKVATEDLPAITPLTQSLLDELVAGS
jgi:uncharacterized protein with HEPN domain